jgi:hypothetical protein
MSFHTMLLGLRAGDVYLMNMVAVYRDKEDFGPHHLAPKLLSARNTLPVGA